MGVDPERLRLEHISAGEGARYAEVVNHFSAAMAELGPSGLNAKQKEKMLKVTTQVSRREDTKTKSL